jgi:hypothetical protein
MLALISALRSWLICRLKSRAALELEVVALRHQLAVLRRQRSGRPKLTSVDRLLWVWLYRYGRAVWKLWYWSNQRPWSSGIAKVPGSTGGGVHGRGPRADREIRDLIRHMGRAKVVCTIATNASWVRASCVSCDSRAQLRVRRLAGGVTMNLGGQRSEEIQGPIASGNEGELAPSRRGAWVTFE